MVFVVRGVHNFLSTCYLVVWLHFLLLKKGFSKMSFEFCNLQSSTVTPRTVRAVPMLDYCEEGSHAPSQLCVSLTHVNELLEGTPLWRREGALGALIPDSYALTNELMTDTVNELLA